MSVQELLSLAGRRALITGGGRGLGRALAVGFAEAGADIVIVARRQHLLDGTAEIIRDAGGSVTTVAADITVELAILADTGLTERQKQSLLDVYSSFMAMNTAANPPSSARSEDGESPNPVLPTDSIIVPTTKEN